MKRVLALLLCAAMLPLTACGIQPQIDPGPQYEANVAQNWEGAVSIELSDEVVKVDGETAPTDETAAVYTGAPIVYYESGHDFTYGEGTEADAHSAEEAAAHTVVTIRQPGEYILRGELSAGQIAVDLGEDAEDDINARVTLVLDGVNITCTVAPAVIFYNVYECGSDDAETAVKDVDTTHAGANVYINGGTVNTVNGSYVARIYKPGTVELNEDGTEVEDAKKLHKYDAAFYSKMSMNMDGGGVLHINAENEGLDTELHLTINGGNIDIKSGNDGINTNEDNVSVTTINGGRVQITVTGETGEGDGIDSNGWLVINEGATVIASACADSADAGIDSDMGIHIADGSLVIASGHMLDRIEGAEQNYAVFQFGEIRPGREHLTLKGSDGAEIVSVEPANDYSVLLVSMDNLLPGEYTLWSGETQLGHSGVRTGGMGGFAGGGGRPGGMMPGGMQSPDRMEPPEGFDPGNMPEIPVWNEGMERPEPPAEFDGGNLPFVPADLPEGMQPPQGDFGPGFAPGGFGGGERTAAEGIFTIEAKENYFSGVGELAE